MLRKKIAVLAALCLAATLGATLVTGCMHKDKDMQDDKMMKDDQMMKNDNMRSSTMSSDPMMRDGSMK